MLKRLSDKTIGRNIMRQKLLNHKFYTVKSNNWDEYNRHISDTYSTHFKRSSYPNVDNVLADTISKQNVDIRDIKSDINHLFAKINTCNINYNNVEKRVVLLAAEVHCILDELEKRIDQIEKK